MIILDRIEGNVAVLDVDGMRIDFPLDALPSGLVEGDALSFRKVPASDEDEKGRLARLRKTATQGPGEFDL